MGYVYFQNNPMGKQVGDCVVRALSKSMDMSWDDAYMELAMQGLCMCDMPNSNSVWGAFLYLNGYKRESIEVACPDCYTVKDFCMEHPTGDYILGTGSHAIAVCSGNYFDSSDSGNENPVIVWEKVR